MKNIFLSLFTALLLSISFNPASAQCNAFTKKKCMPTLSPYIHNGQLNSVALAPGEDAELVMTFYSGQDYRLLVCNQEVLGDVSFKVLDSQHTQLFDSKEDKTGQWDFYVKSTQQLIVQVIVPPAKSKTGIVDQGCVSVLVGFKK